MQLDNTLIIVTVFAVILLMVIVAYRRRIKASVRALGAELNVEAEGRSERSSAPPTAAPASESAPPARRTVTASGTGAVAIGGSGKGANIVTGSDNTVGDGARRKR